MRLATILKILVVLVVAVVVGAAVVLMNIDFNQYKGLIAEKVKEATGRDLVIEGDIKLALSLSPALAVDGVKFQNAAWGSQPNMAVVQRFEVQVALLPLLSKTIEVNYIVLKGADFLIERDKQGRVNYDFETAGVAPKPIAAPPPTEGAPASLQLPLVHKVLIEEATLTYKDASTGKSLVLALQSAALSGTGPDSPVDFALEGTYNKAKFKASGQLGATSALTDPAKPWPVKLAMEAGGAKVTVNGSIRDVAGVDGLQLAVAIEGESLSSFSEFAGTPIPAIGPYSVATSVRGGLARTISLQDISAKVGKSDIGGKLDVKLGGKVPVMNGGFKSGLIDLADFTGKGGGAAKAGASAGSGAATGSAAGGKATDGRLFPADPLPLDGLKAVEADIALDAKRILVQGAAVENLRLALALHGGRLKVDPLKAEVSKGTIDARMQLDGAAATPLLDATLKATKIDLGKLLTDMDITKLLEGSANGDASLKGQGNSVRALMAGMNADVKVVMGEGRVKTTALDGFIGGPTQIVTKMISGEKKEYTVLNCVVSQTEIRNGLATLKVAAVDTEYARITGNGTVNLATEALDVGVVPEPKSATLNLAVGVKIRGTLAKPSYGLDELGAIRKLGGAVLGVGFPPALLLGLGETGASGDSPCLAPAKSSGGQPPAEQKNPIEKATEGVGNMLKGLFGK